MQRGSKPPGAERLGLAGLPKCWTISHPVRDASLGLLRPHPSSLADSESRVGVNADGPCSVTPSLGAHFLHNCCCLLLSFSPVFLFSGHTEHQIITPWMCLRHPKPHSPRSPTLLLPHVSLLSLSLCRLHPAAAPAGPWAWSAAPTSCSQEVSMCLPKGQRSTLSLAVVPFWVDIQDNLTVGDASDRKSSSSGCCKNSRRWGPAGPGSLFPRMATQP